ncbi:MAG TPA: S8 family serine peptidase, partial [Vicinamibacterales bacterium]|nr:S8 family serine peptidase [Vicinamibacterales bacterium]
MIRHRYARTLASLLVLAVLALAPAQAVAGERLIVRTSGLLDLPIVRSLCKIVGCNVLYALDGTLGKLSLITIPEGLNVPLVINLLETVPGVSVELDQIVHTQQSRATATHAPLALYDKEPVSYYGTTVRGGYVRQPAVDILDILGAHRSYGVTGRDVTVAIIDTGVDPHPALKSVLLPGYDFTRNRNDGSERSDVNQSTMAILDGNPGFVNQSTMAILDQSTMAILDGPDHAAFGHGTMVAGVVHLTAPRARILPLKAFKADGSGYASDVLRAIYTAVNQNADVLNMSFSFATRSRELENALNYATARGLVPVASTGNNGQRINVYPAALSNVIGVASSTDWDTLSNFSNYGPTVAWIAAPGEAIVSTYPFGSYAAAWGTSFSTPFASGTAALLIELNGRITPSQ